MKTVSDIARRAAEAVNENRLWQRHIDMAEIGATANGGVNRQAFTDEDRRGRKLFIEWATALGCTLAIDPIGNLFARRAGRDGEAAPVVTGSHLDSQPTGGRFDGTYGVLAGLEVVAALNDTGIVTRRPVEVVDWSNEEGSRYAPGLMGSSVYAGALELDKALSATDRAGNRAGDDIAGLLAKIPRIARRGFGLAAAAYVEAHIEQGPLLESAGKTIGIVEGIQGARWFEVDVAGEESHAGTTPVGRRRDALRAALRIVAALEAALLDAADTVRFTVGRFEVLPGSTNTVPGQVTFTIDLRHPDETLLERAARDIHNIAAATAPPCRVAVAETMNARPIRFERRVPDLVGQAAAVLGLSAMEVFSGAMHDAKNMAGHCPTGMIFIPCERGLSHNEAENATPTDVAAGARVLAHVVTTLAEQD